MSEIVEPPVIEESSTDSPSTAFADFYRTEYPKAMRLAWLLTNRSADSEDLVQEAFSRLGPRFAGLDNASAYLRVAIVNGCREAHRRRTREERRLQLVATALIDLGDVDGSDAHLLALVAALPYPQRAALVLRYWADLADSDIAEVLGVRPATVRSMVHRATRRLHQELSQ